MAHLALIGHQGRLASCMKRWLTQQQRYQLTHCIERGESLTSLTAANTDLAIESSNQRSVFTNSQALLQQGIPLLVAASGLTSEQLPILAHIAQERGIRLLVVANFSLGAILMQKWSQEAAHYFPHAHILEAHHVNKIDSPSATALQTAKRIAQAHSEAPSIASVRMHGVLAEQTVSLGHDDQLLQIHHRVQSHEAFRSGFLLALERFDQLPIGLTIGLEHFLTM